MSVPLVSHPEKFCPCCGNKLGRYAKLNGNELEEIRPGTLSICIYCHAPLAYPERGTFMVRVNLDDVPEAAAKEFALLIGRLEAAKARQQREMGRKP